MRNSKVYFSMVQKFVAAHGPAFELVAITQGAKSTCDCCGYHPLVNNFIVKGEDGSEHVIGSECQQHVLGGMGKPSAEFVREMTDDQLVDMGFRYSVDVRSFTHADKSFAVIRARRSLATKKSWEKRRAMKAATP